MKKVKPPIVILHGWALSGKRFAPLAEEFTRIGYEVYAPDFPGFGNAPIPTHALTLSDYADFLSDYLKKEKIESPIFIGHSFGGRVTLRFLTRHPGIVRAVVLTGTPGYSPVPRWKFILFVGVAKIGKILLSVPLFSGFVDRIRRGYYYLVGAREFYRAEGPMRQTFKNIVSDILDNDMRSVTVPCLLLWGENDAIVPIRIAQRMQKVIRASRLEIIPAVRHGFPFENPTQFAQAAETFIRHEVIDS